MIRDDSVLKILFLEHNLQFSIKSFYVFLNIGGCVSQKVCSWTISTPLKVKNYDAEAAQESCVSIFECLIVIEEEFRISRSCYKIQRSSTDMYMTCACYKSTYKPYKSTYVLA